MKHASFSSVGPDTFAKEKIVPRSLDIIQDKIQELELLGQRERTGELNVFTVARTKRQISWIREHKSFSVSLPSYYLA